MAVTPQRSVRLHDDIWEPTLELAERRDVSASWLIRQLLAAEIKAARETGELPKRRRKK